MTHRPDSSGFFATLKDKLFGKGKQVSESKVAADAVRVLLLAEFGAGYVGTHPTRIQEAQKDKQLLLSRVSDEDIIRFHETLRGYGNYERFSFIHDLGSSDAPPQQAGKYIAMLEALSDLGNGEHQSLGNDPFREIFLGLNSLYVRRPDNTEEHSVNPREVALVRFGMLTYIASENGQLGFEWNNLYGGLGTATGRYLLDTHLEALICQYPEDVDEIAELVINGQGNGQRIAELLRVKREGIVAIPLTGGWL